MVKITNRLRCYAINYGDMTEQFLRFNANRFHFCFFFGFLIH